MKYSLGISTNHFAGHMKWAQYYKPTILQFTSSVHKPSGQIFGFPSSHVRMWELDHKESWALKNWCFWTVLLEKTLESPLDCKDIKPVHPKGNQSQIFIRRTDAEAEAPILWPPYANGQLIRKDPDAEKDWRQEEKGMTEDKMIWWHHRLSGYEFEQLREMVKNWEGGLDYCSPWVTKRQDWVTK